MLKEERQHFEKMNRVVYGQPEKFNGLLSESPKDQSRCEAAPNVLQQLDINSLQRVSDSFCNESVRSESNERRSLEMTMPQKSLCDQRNKAVEQIIFGVGQRLK